jgi:ATP-dependent Clp protease ATP-binding subunit ClpA
MQGMRPLTARRAPCDPQVDAYGDEEEDPEEEEGEEDADGGGEVLSKLGKDLTAAARKGKMDPVIGRDEEVQQCLEILCRRGKNNPILIGEPGARPTA